MEDLISRQVAIDALRDARHRFTVADEAGGLGTVKWSEDVIYFAAAERVLSDLPSAQPKTGKWIRDGYDFPHGNDWIHCSVCGKRGINVPADLTNFCPNCGADMRGE